jgi:uncharacterized protein YkwD
MRWFILLITVVLVSFAPFASAQETPDTVCTVKAIKDLPKAGQKSRFRIQVKMHDGSLRSLLTEAKEFTNKNKITSYVLLQDGRLKIHIGDYSDKKYAKQRMPSIKKRASKAKIVKVDNDSILAFFLVEKKKPAQGAASGTEKPYKVKYEPPLKPSEVPVKPKVEPQPVKSVSVAPSTSHSTKADPNTAAHEPYLSESEKKVYYYLNLVRQNPKQFCDTYLPHTKGSSNHYESSLYKELQVLKPLPLFKPNQKLYESAKCHARESGISGYVGHERTKCAEYFMGECCHYGVEEPLQIVIDLLIDQGVSSLGHRKIILDPGYTELGVSMQPHKGYGINTVLDFR